MGVTKRRTLAMRILMVIVLLAAPFLPAYKARAAIVYQLGIASSTTLLFTSEATMHGRLKDMKDLGVSLVRVDFSWELIQQNGYDYFDWRYHDRLVKAAASYGIDVMPLVTYSPAWARNPRCTALLSSNETRQKCSPRDIQEFARFVHIAAERYTPYGVTAWEIWNEPNTSGFLRWVNADGNFEISPETYGRLANEAGKAIRGVNANAVVVTGGLAPAFDPQDPKAMRPGDFLRRMLPFLEKGGITAIGIHPYTQPALPREHADWNAFYTVDRGGAAYNLRGILDAAGRTDLQIWGTEFGATTIGQRDRVNSLEDRKIPGKVFDHVSEDIQALIIRQGVEDWFAKDNIGPLFIHADSDMGLDQRSNEGGFGLRRVDGSKKPAYGELKAVAEKVMQKYDPGPAETTP